MAYFRDDAQEDFVAFHRRGQLMTRGLTVIGSSDYQFLGQLGLGRTYVFIRKDNEKDILEALREGRTVVYDRDGRAYGDPALTQLLRERPLARNAEHASRPHGALRRLAALSGWLGLAGLLVLRPPASAE